MLRLYCSVEEEVDVQRKHPLILTGRTVSHSTGFTKGYALSLWVGAPGKRGTWMLPLKLGEEVEGGEGVRGKRLKVGWRGKSEAMVGLLNECK